MTARDPVDFTREDLERVVGRLPRYIAYPLIAILGLLLWIPIGIGAGALLRFLFS